MTKAELTVIVNALIIQGDVIQALEALSEYVSGIDNYVGNDILLQMAKYNRNRRDFDNGLMRQGDYQMEMNRLNYAITHLLERLPDEGNQVAVDIASPPVPVEPTNNKPEVAEVRKILFLSANPSNMTQLSLGQELRKVKDGLSAATQRDKFKLESESAVKVSTITKAMQVQMPEIVHFSGHGLGGKTGKAGLFVENDTGQSVLFPTEGLDMLFELFKDSVKCVVLNACYSKEHAKAISRHGIYVVGMDEEIGDVAAVNFSVGFYQSIGEGKDFKFAFKIALINISTNLSDAHRPELWLDGEKIS
jgi:hypothetical protein